MADFAVGVGASAQIKLGVADQARAFGAAAQRIAVATLRTGGRRFRARMERERLSAPRPMIMERGKRLKMSDTAPLSVKTGALKRSLRYQLLRETSAVTLQAKIGGGKAYYADKWEDRGRLQFGRIFGEEAKRTEDELRLAYEAAGRLGASKLGSAAPEPPSAGDDPRGGLFAQLGQHYEAKKARAKENRLGAKVRKYRAVYDRVIGGIR